MEILSLVSTIMIIHILAWLTPGPLFFIIIRNSLLYSRKIWYFTALGFSLWNFVHIILAISGISLLMQSSTIMLYGVRLLGIAYLLYLWGKTLVLSSMKKEEREDKKHTKFSSLKAVKMGFIASMSSVGAYLFFASIFSTVYWREWSYVAASILILAMPLNTFIMASILNIFFTQDLIKKQYEKYSHLIHKWLGLSLIILAWISSINFLK